MKTFVYLNQELRTARKWAREGSLDRRASALFLRGGGNGGGIWEFLPSSSLGGYSDPLILSPGDVSQALPPAIRLWFKESEVLRYHDRVVFWDGELAGLPEVHRDFLTLLIVVYLFVMGMVYRIIEILIRDGKHDKNLLLHLWRYGLDAATAPKLARFFSFYGEVVNLSLDDYLSKPVTSAEVGYVYSIYAQLTRLEFFA